MEISRAKKGAAYIYLLFLMNGIFSIIMMLLRITFLSATVSANAVAAANLYTMARYGIYRGLESINENIADHSSTIVISVIGADPPNFNYALAQQAIEFVNQTNFTRQMGEYAINIRIYNNIDGLQVRSIATKQGIYSFVDLVAIVNVNVETYIVQQGYSLEVRLIVPPTAEIYVVYEVF